MASMSFLLNQSSTGSGNPLVEVTLTENADGTITFTMTQLVAAGNYLGDLRGLFFDFADESLLGSLFVTSASRTLASGATVAVTQPTWASGNDNVKKAGSSSNNMNGLLGSDGGYDFGIEIGSEGVGRNGDDVRAFSFTLDSSLRDLTLADFANVDFGARITSVGRDLDGNGTIDTARAGSAKVGAVSPSAPVNHAPVAVADTSAGDAVVEAGVAGDGHTAFAGDSSAVGNVLSNDSDADADDVLAVSGVVAGNSGGPVSGNVGTAVTGVYGTLTLGADGSWSYALDNTDGQTNALVQGEFVADVFTYTVSDGSGGFGTATLTIDITGTNDAAVIGGVSTDAVQEDVDASGGTLSASGALTIVDVDAGQSSFAPQAATAGAYGTFTLDAAGNWTYAADNSQAAIQGLAVDEQLTDSFTATSLDGSASQTVTVTINGSNDVVYTVNDTVDPSATKLGAGTQLIVGSGIPASGFGLASQTDVGVELGFQVIYRQGPTVLSTDDYADGVLHFTVNDGPQSTENGSFANHAGRAAWNFNYSIATGLDGNPGNLDSYTFRLLYDIDPTAAASYRTLVLEPGGTGSSAHSWRDQGTGLVFIADDGGNAGVTQNSENYAFAFFQSFLTQPYGPSNNFDGPAQFDIVLEAHRSGQLLAANHIAVDVIESNDAPVAVNDAAAVQEDGTLSASGNVLTNDADNDVGDTRTVMQVNGSAANVGALIATAYGSVTINANGSYTYNLDNAAAQSLAAGQQVTDSFTYTMADLDGATSAAALNVTISGTNDVPVIGGVSTDAVQEDVDASGGTLSASGALTIVDVDAGQSSFAPQAATAGAYGTFTLDATGNWTYTANNSQPAIQGLAVDEQLTDSFTAVSFDGSASQTVTVTINGTNDVVYTVNDTVDPSATKLGAGTELIAGTGIPASGFGLASQTDVGVELGFQVIYRQGPTVLSTDDYADGVLHFTVNDGPQSTENGSFANHAGRAAWNFNYSIATGLDGETTDLDDFTFHLKIDLDPTAAQSYAVLQLAYDPLLNVVTSPSGYIWEDIFTNPAIVDDAGNANVTQNSQNYAFYQSFLTGGMYGLANNFDGPAHFDLVLEAYRSGYLLAANHIAVDVVESNDAPVAADDAAAVQEDGTLSASGNVLTNDADNDVGDTRTVMQVNGSAANVGALIATAYGSVTINANGSYTYNLDNAAVQSLAAGQQVTDSFAYTMADLDGATSSATLNVTITGMNDAPAIVGAPSGNLLVNGGFEDTSFGGTYNNFVAPSNAIPGWLVVQDGVQGVGEPYWQASEGLNSVQMKLPGVNHFGAIEQIFATQAGVQYDVTFDMTGNNADGATHSVLVSADGQSQSYSASGSGFNNANMGWSPRAFSFIADGSSATLRIASTDMFLYGAVVDNFVVTAVGGGPPGGSAAEAADNSAQEIGNILHEAIGSIAFADIDLTDTHSVTVTPNGIGYRGILSASVADDTTGDGAGTVSWTFAVEDTALDDLAANQVLTQTYDVTAVDNHGATAVQTVTINITGANDGPVAHAQAVATDEDQPVNGTLTATDADAADDLDFALAGGEVGGTVTAFDAETGAFTFTPNADFSGIASFEFTATDGTLSDSAAVNITVNAINDAPALAVPDNFALSFDGAVAGDQVQVGSPVPFAGQSFSWEFRTNRTSNLNSLDSNIVFNDSGATFAGNGNHLHVGYRSPGDGSGDFTFAFFNNDLNYFDPAGDNADNGTFVHWAGSYDAATGERKLYKNGVLVAQDNAGVAAYNGPGDFFMGSDFNGQVDYLRLWDGVRSQAAFQDSAAGTTPADLSSARLAYEFNESGGTVAVDSSANGNDGTIAGTPASVLLEAFDPTTDENTPLIISGVTVSDVDAGANPLLVSLSVVNGALALTSSAGLAFTDADGTDGALAFTGSQAGINAALASSILYTPDLGFNGSDTLTIVADDQGHTGAGGALSDTETIGITVNAGNDAPLVPIFPLSYSVAEASNFVRTVLDVTSADGLLGGAFPPFDPDGPLPLTAWLVGDGPDHGDLVLDADGSFTYQPDPYYLSYTSNSVIGGTFSFNYSGPVVPDTFTYRVFDGLDYSAVRTVEITVTPPPQLHIGSIGYDMQGSHDPVTEPMGQFYDDLTGGGLTFTQGIDTNTTVDIPSSAGFTVTTGVGLTYIVSGVDLAYGPGNVPVAGTIASITIRNPAYDPDNPGMIPPDLLSLLNGGGTGVVPNWSPSAAAFAQALQAYAASSSDRDGLDAIFQTVRYTEDGGGPEGYEAAGLVGGPFDDYFAGAVGFDTIYGGPGNDFIIPGADGGSATGGLGRDWFQYGHGDAQNVITDFSGVFGGEQDIIDLSATFSFPDLAAVLANASQTDANGDSVLDAVIASPLLVSDPLVLTLLSTNVGDLQAADFLFSTFVNGVPETHDVAAQGDEDTVVPVVLSGIDLDGSVASFQFASLPANGALYAQDPALFPVATPLAQDDLVGAMAGNTATVYFKPDPDWNGATAFNYAAVDNVSQPDLSPATATITVNPVDDLMLV